MTTKVVVLGSNFGGLVAALDVAHELKDEVEVTVVSPSKRFLFTPSLIWVPFGKRTVKKISFPVEPTLNDHDVNYVHAAATGIDPHAKTVTADNGDTLSYDYLIVATGYHNDYDTVPGIGKDGGGNAVTISNPMEAEFAAAQWKQFLDNPGDIVVGATQSAGCFGAAYEFMFNAAHQLKKNKLHKDVKITYLTSEPFLGHFGIGGMKHGESLLNMFFKMLNIEHQLEVEMEAVDDGAVVLKNGDKVPFTFAMVMPPFLGQDFLKDVPNLTDAKGYIPVNDTYQSKAYPEIFAVGVAAQVTVPWTTAVPVGVPKTGFPTEVQSHTAAKNIAALVRGETMEEHKEFGEIPAVCVMDAGNNGVIILADHLFEPRKHSVMIPGPQAHGMKLGFEKYFLWKAKHGFVRLP